MIRKLKTYYCAYCPNKEIDFGNICSTCKGKKRKGVKLEKLYVGGVYTIKVGKIAYVKSFIVDESKIRI